MEKLFKVTITETLVRTVGVKAEEVYRFEFNKLEVLNNFQEGDKLPWDNQ